jgi:murein DD-endopeptidase MepM/ murein hydrolase activator NlpD
MFPLKKNFILSNSEEDKFLQNYLFHTEIPMLPHPGAFGKQRKNHIHEGVDIYCEDGDIVYSMEEGVVLMIDAFTGKHAGSPWWADTWHVLVQHKNYVINYGEIIPSKSISLGSLVKEGDILGEVKSVLLKDKGRPRSMLHLEMYTLGTKSPIGQWGNNDIKPTNLLDPTNILQEYITN